jgi:hypothetical protein
MVGQVDLLVVLDLHVAIRQHNDLVPADIFYSVVAK